MSALLFFGALSTFALGVAVQTVWSLSSSLIFLCLLLSLAVGLIWRRNHTQISAPYLLLFSVLLCSLAVGLLRTEVAAWSFGVSPLQTQVGQEIEFTGIVTREVKRSANATQFYVSDSHDTLLVSTDRYSSIAYGDLVTVTGELIEPSSFVTELGRTFDYPNYLKAKGVEYQISFAQIERQESGQGNPLLAGLLKLKHIFMTKLERVIPEPQVGLGEGLLLGVKQALGEDIEEDFRRTGIIHIVVLSGYNVMLVVTFIMLCFSAVFSPKARAVAGILMIICFALLVGLSATVVRASIMAGLVLLAQGFSRQYDVMRALFFAGAVMLLINPYLLIYDIGFQLSFMATLGLLLITPHFEATVLTGVRSLKLKDFFFATLATQLAVLPLLLYHIGQVSLVAIIVNVLVLPAVPTAMLLTFLTGLLAFVSVPVAAVVGFAANVSLLYILWVAQWFSWLPFAAINIQAFSVLSMSVFYVILAAVLVYIRWRPKSKKTQNLSDWTIEEESENPALLSVESRAGVATDKLPKIFR